MEKINANFCGATIVQSNVLAENSAVFVQQEEIDWLGALSGICDLRKKTTSKTMLAFADEIEQAARQSNWEKFKAAARKIGEFGLEYLREASISVLAELTSKALLGI